jgi:hypothetical protein
VVSVIPVTSTELQLAKARGPEALIEAFEREGVKNIFDPFRNGISGETEGGSPPQG